MFSPSTILERARSYLYTGKYTALPPPGQILPEDAEKIRKILRASKAESTLSSFSLFPPSGANPPSSLVGLFVYSNTQVASGIRFSGPAVRFRGKRSEFEGGEKSQMGIQ